MKTRTAALSCLLLTACFEPVEGEVGLGAKGAWSLGEHTLHPWVTGGVALIEGPNGVSPDRTTFPKHLSRVTEVECTSPCQLVSGPAADFSFVVRADQPGESIVSGLVTLDNGEKHRLEEHLVFVEVTRLEARCVEGACPGPMAQLVGTASVWAVTGTGPTADGGEAEVVVDDVTIEGANDAVSVKRVESLPGVPATMLVLTAAAPGAVTLTLRHDQAKLVHQVRVVQPTDVTRVALKPARSSSDVIAWGKSGKTIDETATLDGPLTAQVALVGTTSEGVEVLGNAQALQFQITRAGSTTTSSPQSPTHYFTEGEFLNWASPNLFGASSFTVTGSLGTATAEATVALP